MLLARGGKRATWKYARALLRSYPQEISSPEPDLLGDVQSLAQGKANAQGKENNCSALDCSVGEGKTQLGPSLAIYHLREQHNL